MSHVDIHRRRLQLLVRRLRARGLDAILVSQPENRYYLSGYTARNHGIQESAGYLLVPGRGSPYLLTDSRFQLQAEEEAAGFRVELYPRGLARLLASLLPALGVRRLGFESDYILYSTVGRLQKQLQAVGVDLVALRHMVERMRMVKDELEIELLRSSVRLNERVFQRVHATLQAGMSERDIALCIESTMREMGAERPAFETIVAFGENGARPHAVPGERLLAHDDIVLIDMGLVHKGYCSDMTRTFVLGEPEELYVERHRLVRRAQLAGMAAIRAGVTCREVDRAARQVIRDSGHGVYFGHALGHGVGLAIHEEPRLSSRSRRKLRPGMVVTVEPGIYLPGWGGIRLENMVVVRENGCEQLNEDTTFLDLE